MTEKLIYATAHYAALAVFLLCCWGMGRWIMGRQADARIQDFWLGHALCATFGTGVFICALQLLAVAGLLLPPFILALTALGLLLALLQLRHRPWRSAGRLHWTFWLILAIAACTVLFPLRPPLTWDELAYHLPHARQWALSGRLQVNEWLRYPWFPFNYNLLYAGALAVYDDVFAHMLHAYAGWLTALLVYRFGLHMANRATAFLACALWLVLARPEFANAYIDMGVALFVFAAFICLQLWLEDRRSRACMLLGAFLLGVAIGSKYQGLLFLPLFAAAVVWKDRRPSSWLLCAAAVALPCIYWYGRNFVMTGDPVAPLGGRIFGFTDWNMGDYAHQFEDIRLNYGWPHPALWPALLTPLLIPRARHRMAYACAVVFGGYSVAVWMATSHYPRYLLAAYPVLCILSVSVCCSIAQWLLEPLARHAALVWADVRARAVLKTGSYAIALSLLVHFAQPGIAREWSLVAVTPEARAEVVKVALPEYAGTLDYLQKHRGLRVYQSGMEGALYYAPPPIWGDHFGPWRYRDFVTLPPRELAQRLRQQKFDTLVLSVAGRERLLDDPDMARYFTEVRSDPFFRIFRVKPSPDSE
ncbi:ArnT family glycosyltransferase [Xylophilus sp. ASV27]|uniref:ArnT family glycosyltransferase n=1 Tax=Xylophilus sp. ASV27 TaxID=2795129 RepID=UPI0018ED0718|nr:hypothetical protein [Xylophilus sp. ASV27]